MATQDVKYQHNKKMTTTELQLSRNGQKCVTGDVTFTANDKVAYIVVNADATFSNLTDQACLLYTSPSPRDRTRSRMPSSA